MRSWLPISALGTLWLIFTVSAADLAGQSHAPKNAMVFPGKDWTQASPESQGVDPARLNVAMDYLARSLGEPGGAATVFIVRWSGFFNRLAEAITP